MSAAVKHDAAATRRAEYIARLVDSAPPLSASQLDRLAVLVRPTVRGEAASR